MILSRWFLDVIFLLGIFRKEQLHFQFFRAVSGICVIFFFFLERNYFSMNEGIPLGRCPRVASADQTTQPVWTTRVSVDVEEETIPFLARGEFQGYVGPQGDIRALFSQPDHALCRSTSVNAPQQR
eukprot:m.214696 g.214696  ORF g.214696 m.214696 type:complete len:126 (-) comp54065_c2_seq4:100-477(-)